MFLFDVNVDIDFIDEWLLIDDSQLVELFNTLGIVLVEYKDRSFESQEKVRDVHQYLRYPDAEDVAVFPVLYQIGEWRHDDFAETPETHQSDGADLAKPSVGGLVHEGVSDRLDWPEEKSGQESEDHVHLDVDGEPCDEHRDRGAQLRVDESRFSAHLIGDCGDQDTPEAGSDEDHRLRK